MKIPPPRLIVTQNIRKAKPEDFKYFTNGEFLPRYGKVYCIWLESYETFSNWRAFNVNTDLYNIADALQKNILYVQDETNVGEVDMNDFFMVEQNLIKEMENLSV